MNAPPRQGLPPVMLGALGVVFGDIGTSPLYAIRQCFQDLHNRAPGTHDVLGVLSLVFWSLVLVVCVKYLTFVLRADYEGEGGTLALLGLIRTKGRPKGKALGGLVLLVFFGSALLYGDGVITPSISVLSAVEGLKVATPAAEPYIVPICVAILTGLFLLQRFGTGRVGGLFGPVMVVWFLVIGGLGAAGIARAPQVLGAVNPWEAVRFLGSHGPGVVLVLGAVVLAFSGAEALFADLGHFGRVPIRAVWYGLVLPGLLLNYFGQGALILSHPAAAQAPFYALVPRVALYPMVALATIATIIASQAVISGAFSLTQQGIHLGYLPPFRVTHTSDREPGQIYVSVVNWMLMIACLVVVIGFRSSERLTGAYGLALTGTMIVTSIAYFVVLRRVWHWPLLKAGAVAGTFILIDLAFFVGNAAKIFSGAWVPLLLGAFVFSIYWIWTAGHIRYQRALRRYSLPNGEFIRELAHDKHRHTGTAVFLTGHPDTVPLVRRNSWLRRNSHYKQVILLTVISARVPRVDEADSGVVEELAPGFHLVTKQFGYMQEPDVTRILDSQSCASLLIDWNSLVYFLPEASVVPLGNWRRRAVARAFDYLRRNSLTPAKNFRIPSDQIVHIGVRLEI
jgi:KUP system potassium uptake protein